MRDTSVFLAAGEVESWDFGHGKGPALKGECRSYPGVELACGAQGSEVDGDGREMPKFYPKWYRGNGKLTENGS